MLLHMKLLEIHLGNVLANAKQLLEGGGGEKNLPLKIFFFTTYIFNLSCV